MNLLSFLEYDFMRNALLAVCIITPLFGLMGTMVVENKMAFFSDALGHSALTGIGIGVILGIGNVNLIMIVFAILFALLLNKIKQSRFVGTDTVISVFSSLSIALGLAILSQGGNFSRYSSVLVGDVLSITAQEIVNLAVIFGAILIFWLFCFNMLHAISINRSLAASYGVPVKWMENLFAAALAVIVMLSIRWVGILLINALLILPAAAARNISANMREYHYFSVLFSLFSGILGLVVSFYCNMATGPAIVIVAAVIFFCTFFYSKSHGS